jgi:predicted enzyme related to lactoylglutathione lyase
VRLAVNRLEKGNAADMGRPIHFEIHASDPERVLAFYRDLFGWTFKRWGEQPYWLATTGDGAGIDGAVVERRGSPPAAGQPVNAFVVTVGVDDVEAAATLAEEAGGTVVVPRQPVPGVGWLAYVTDPDGNLLGLMQDDPQAS